MSNKFAGVDDIYFTPKSICTVKVFSKKVNGRYRTFTKRRYHTKTGFNVKKALSVHGYIRNKK